MELTLQNITAAIEQKEILHNISLTLKPGKVHVLMGPNGSGKSTLAQVLMGNEKYQVKSGKIFLGKTDITKLSPEERAKKGIFLAFQYPKEISGVTLINFLRTAYRAVCDPKISIIEFHKLLVEKMKQLQLDTSFANRYVNEGFSGGEKKKAEMLQMLVLEPSWIILDETDSGLDVDALKIVARAVQTMKEAGKSILVITHYSRILEHLEPDIVYVMKQGKMVKQGGRELIAQIETEGFGK